MGTGCSTHSSVHVQSPLENTRKNKKKLSIEDQINQRRKIIFQNEMLASSFIEFSSPRNGMHIKWRKGEIIGEGAYAKVYQCINLNNGELMAVKSFYLGDDPKKIEKEFENMKKEVSLLRNLDHHNIVHYYQTDLSNDMYTIDVLLEYVPGGSLKMILQKYRTLEVEIIRNYAKQLLEGLSYLHKNFIVHRDLKSANVLVTSQGVVKLTDFGSSIKFNESDVALSKSFKGSPYWMAPEVVLRQGHSFAADIWSFGCVLIEMITGHPPWSNFSKETKAVLNLISKENSLPTIPNTEIELKNIITACVCRDPKLRPTTDQILAMPFFQISLEGK
ncbi:hypothetical protein SteCoe_18944 [Stentor coeruleus]|uniref:Protein kinase domain-containing protein n=1 Tax=Stentor coeruleus TaxID=5963 RepID=A0A1R2BVQ5_9CILI|nr:hypothetical protein SteCoe_18944 [Stentor coeruleus]